MLPTWTTACPDWERRIVERDSLIACPPLFPSVASDAWAICSALRLTDVAGQPLLAEAALPWLREFAMAVFGAENPQTGRRHINEFFLMVSKKNAKSTIAAAIMLCALLMNWRPSAELLILSPTKEIADNSYKPIRDFIRADAELSALLQVQDYWRIITHLDTGATLKVVAADASTVSGKKASFVFVDELHEFGKQPKASNMLLEATGGLASRPEGFVIYATTQSSEPPAGVFLAKLRYARDVRDGVINDPKFLPVLYEYPKALLESRAYENLDTAYITNPNWGASVDIERITQLASQAKAGGENEYKEFLAKHLNVEIGLNLRSDRWSGADCWESATAHYTLEQLIARSEVITAGIDGGGSDDLMALALVGRCRDTGHWLTWSRAWADPKVLTLRKQIAPRLQDFAHDGDLVITPLGNDTIELAAIVADIDRTGLLDRIGIDPAAVGGILESLAAANVSREKIIGISQGWRLGGTIKTVDRKLAEGGLKHCGQRLLTWSVGNARVELRGNAILVTKAVSGQSKIDPLMALFNAAELMSQNPAGAGKSFWDGA